MKDKIFHVWTVWHPQPASYPVPKTYLLHKNILDKYKEVFWGIITDRMYQNGHPFDKEMEIIDRQLSNGTKTLLFIKPRDDEEKPICGEIKQVMIDLPGWHSMKTVPDYYNTIYRDNDNYEIPYWFLLSNIKQIDPQIMHQLRKKQIFDTREHGSSGYPYPCICRIADVEEETSFKVLSWKDITITFVNPQTVAIDIKGSPLTKTHYTYEDLKFNDRRIKHRDKMVKAWGVLLFAAANQGILDYKKLHLHFDNFKKMIDNTENRLRDGILHILGNKYKIEGHAFKYQRGSLCYKALFRIEAHSIFFKNDNLNDNQNSSDDIQQIFDKEQERTSLAKRFYGDEPDSEGAY